MRPLWSLVAIDAAEQDAFDHARNEVYVGFTELKSLMPSDDASEEEPAPMPALVEPCACSRGTSRAYAPS